MRFVYYLIIIPLSLLPLSILYKLSDIAYLFIYKLLSYRTKVVLGNLQNSFPEKSTKELKIINSNFYRHLCDLMIESIYLFNISNEEVVRRFKLTTPEILEKFKSEGKSVILACGHYNNWEMAAVAIDPQIPHHTIGLYTPMSNSFFDKKFKESRSKFGTVMLSKKEVRDGFEENKDKLIAWAFGTDQCPHIANNNVYWMDFLNQDTAVLFGTERYAKEFDHPVLFMRIDKIKRGHYEFSFDVITENPRETEHGWITERHTQLLEKQIVDQPEYWLWSHKRWKKKRPSEINA